MLAAGIFQYVLVALSMPLATWTAQRVLRMPRLTRAQWWLLTFSAWGLLGLSFAGAVLGQAGAVFALLVGGGAGLYLAVVRKMLRATWTIAALFVLVQACCVGLLALALVLAGILLGTLTGNLRIPIMQ